MGYWSKSAVGAASTAQSTKASSASSLDSNDDENGTINNSDEQRQPRTTRDANRKRLYSQESNASSVGSREEQIQHQQDMRLRKRNWKRVEKQARREIDKFPLFSKERRMSIGELKQFKKQAKKQGKEAFVGTRASTGSQQQLLQRQKQQQQKPEEELQDFTNLMKEFHEGAKEFRRNQKRAKRGNDPDAQYEVGCCYHYGTYVDEDEEAAVRWWIKAANQNHLEAQLKLAWWYQYQATNAPQEHLKWLQRAAENGDVKAQRTMALYYYNRQPKEDQGQKQEQQQSVQDESTSSRGLGMENTSTDSVDYYGSEDGDVLNGSSRTSNSKNNKSDEIVLMPSVKLEASLEMHAHWLEQAALQGDAEAQFMLGLCYHPQSSPMTLLENDESANQPKTQNDEGLLRYDPAMAANWWARAAEQGHPQALYQIAFLYSSGNGVKKRDIRIAGKCWERAADKRVPEAQYQMADCYFHGYGVSFWESNLLLAAHYDSAAYEYYAYHPQPDESATASILEKIRQRVTMIQQAAQAKETNKGDKVDAQLALAFCYREGLVVPQDFVEAQRLSDAADQTMREIRQIADQKVSSSRKDMPDSNDIALATEIANAQIQMAMNMAREVLFRRKQQANDRSMRRRMSSYGSVDSGEGIQEDYIGVAMWLKRAAEQPYIQHTDVVRIAQYRLGDCYWRGWGVSVNYALAMGWLQKSTSPDDEEECDNPLLHKDKRSYQPHAYYVLGQCYFLGRGMDRTNFTEAVKYFHQAYMGLQSYRHPSTEFSMVLAIERCISTIKNSSEADGQDTQRREDAQQAVAYCKEHQFMVHAMSAANEKITVSTLSNNNITSSSELCECFVSILSFMRLPSPTKQDALMAPSFNPQQQ